MKKIFMVFGLSFCVFSLPALSLLDFTGDIGLGYLRYTMITKYDNSKLKNALGDTLKNSLGEGNLSVDDPKSKDVYNALSVGLGLKVSYFYANLSVGFPFKQIPTGNDPLGQKLKSLNASNDIKGSLIFDGQLGAGLTLFKKTPFNFFIGGGLAANYIRTKRNLPKEFVELLGAKSLTEVRTFSMFGLGIDAAVKYYFTKNIGVCLDLKETVYFIPIINKRFYKGVATDGSSFTYTIKNAKTEDKKSQDIKSYIKSSWANNFAIRLGVAFKLN